MKTKPAFAVLTILSVLLLAAISDAADIVATNSGNWGDANVWLGGIVPGTNDDADVEAPYNIAVNTNASVQYIYGSGTVTMSPGSILRVVGDPAGAAGTFQLASLDASAVGNTIIYSGNPFWAKHQDYYNLVFSNTVTTNLVDFYNGTVNSQDPATAMTIAGNMTVIGKIKVQQGDDFTIGGNLIIGTNSIWDCSSFVLTVASNTFINGLLIDLDGGLGMDNFEGNVTVNTSPTGGWNVSDVTQWVVGGSLTNNGRIAGGAGYGSIAFNGTGVITGKPFKIPTLTINGTYMIGTTITLMTNTPTLNGTLVFDLANTNELVLQSYPTNPLTLYYNGNLNVINSGPAPVSGHSYKFFNATNYAGAFASTSFPSLAAGLSWVDNTLTTGSIDVTGSALGSPSLSLSRNGGVLTLSWDSATFPGFHVQAQTNSGGLTTNWGPTGSGTVSPFTISIGPNNRSVFFRLANP